MGRSQQSLFESVFSEPEPIGLVLHPRPNRPLTKPQRTFNRLVAKVEELQASLKHETRRLDEALAYYGKHLHPREQRQNAVRKDLVRALALFLDPSRLKRKNDRKTLRFIIADQLAEIVFEEGVEDDDLRALFTKVHGVGLEEAERQEMEETKSQMEAMFGHLGIDIDLSDMRPDMSLEALAAKAAEMAERIRQKAHENETEFHRAERPKTRRQLEREERMRQAEEVRKKSIASIYKQLARVLHPDLEPDAACRERKVALMQELTTAYRNNDIHTLLRLELEWIEREEGDVERLTDAKLAIYNQVLKEQVDSLQQELAQLPLHPRYQPIVVPQGPFGFTLRMNGPAEARLLDESIASMETAISRLRTEPFYFLRSIVQEYRTMNGT
jgi:hypothetical protein